ncbi:MAG TPA: S9 family peptidase [Steroidobacteraceae bacterium]|nr:S9 family peptidase [Steroidobacteraceae bacterium]
MPTPLTARCILFVLLISAFHSAGAQMLTIERIFAAPDLSGASLRSPQISPDGHYVAYLRGGEKNKDRLDLWAYDIRARKHTLLVDSAQLVPQERALSAEEEQRRERQRTSSLSGILDYQFSPDSQSLLVPLGGDLYVYDLRARGAHAVQRITQTDSFETDARFSPHGRYVSFVRDQNLVVHDLTTGKERAITREGGGLVSFGMAEFIAQEEMSRTTGYWWSPDEKHIAFTRVDESPVAEVDRFEIYADAVKVVKQRYPAAGAKNASVQLFTASLEKAEAAPVQMDLGANTDIYLARVNWFPDGRSLAVQRQSRDQKTLDLLRIDAASGSASELLTEKSDTWVDIHDELTMLERTQQFIWASRRSGHTHLYLYGNDGTLVRALTQGDWEVVAEGDRAIRGVNEQSGRIYFMANAESPLERQLYSVSMAEGAASRKRVTETSGWHAVTMSKDAKVFLDTFSTPDQPPSLTLRAAGGEPLTVLVANEVKGDHPYAPFLAEHVATEFGTLKARDGQTIHYQLMKPRKMEPGKRYPVIVDVYGGPGVQRVRRAWGGYPRSNEGFFREYLAQHGYVVFTLDNRGSGFRGVQFESALYKRMGLVEVEDQVSGVQYLKTLPFVDPARIGVFGWSYGGYMALMCMMLAPGEFAAGVAGAPVTDWSLYDTHYTERFMSTPQANEAGYKSGNVLTYAANLRGPLLVMHGMADDNVLFAHSTTLFKKLQDLNKPFDMMTYPGSKHGLLRIASTGPHGYETVARFFDTHLKAH